MTDSEQINRICGSEWKSLTLEKLFVAPRLKYLLRYWSRADRFAPSMSKTVPEILSRKALDDLTEIAKTYGAKGMAWIKVQENELQSPIIKFFEKEMLDNMLKALGSEPGDTVVFIADTPKIVADALAHLRLALGKQLNYDR